MMDTSITLYCCCVCKQTLHTYTGFINHINSHVIGNKGSLCGICYDSFHNEFRLNIHYRRRHGIVMCEECKLYFLSDSNNRNSRPKVDIFSHIWNECEVFRNHGKCEETFIAEPIWRRRGACVHGQGVTPTNYHHISESAAVELSDIVSEHKESLENKPVVDTRIESYNVKDKSHGVERFTCNVCKMAFVRRGNFMNHLTHGHYEYKCKFCPLSYARAYRLNRHIRTKHSDINQLQNLLELHCEDLGVPCFLCREMHKSGTALLTHLSVAHYRHKFMMNMFVEFILLQRSVVITKGCVHYKCLLCNRMSRSFQHTWRGHLRRDHKKSYSYVVSLLYHFNGSKCAACGEKFTDVEIQSHGCKDYGEFPCSLCNERFLTQSSIDMHFLGAHGSEIHSSRKCKFCDECFEFDTPALESHMRTHSALPDLMTTKCYTCKKSFGKQSLRSHGCQQVGKFPCGKCEERLITKPLWRKHRTSVHGEEITPKEKCDACGKLFYEKARLKQHIKLYHNVGLQSVLCQKCGKQCRYGSYQYHKAICHKNGETGVSCDICGKKYASRHVLSHHVACTHKRRTFICDECGKSFMGQQKLTQHKATHSSERKFKCSFPSCSKSFKFPANVFTHEKIHTDERRVTCKTCGVKFNGYRKLHIHTRAEHGEK